MREYLPLLIVCAVIGVFTILFLAAYAVLKRRTKEETSERHMSDSEIIRRLLGYARPIYSIHTDVLENSRKC